MKYFLITLFVGLLYVTGLTVKSQQNPLFSQHELNSFMINPAIAGADGRTDLNLMARNQWIGFKGAPRTYVLTFEYRLLKKRISVGRNLFGIKRVSRRNKGTMGLGGMVYNDVNAHMHKTGIELAYAYHIKLQHDQLSFGLSVASYQMRLDRELLSFVEEEPLMINNDLRSLYAMDASMGVYYLNHHSFFFGASAEELMQTIDFSNKILEKYKVLRQYYATGGYYIRLNQDYYVEPSALMRINERLIMATDLNVKVHYRDEYWGGLAYRTSGDAMILAGVRYQNLRFSYSMDYSFNKIMSYSYGCHEFTVGYTFGTSDRKFDWLDRY